MKSFSRSEIAKHNRRDDCWVIIHDKVYDVTSFLSEHPGGAAAIVGVSGKDATTQFDMLHNSSVLNNVAEKYCIGKVGDETEAPSSSSSSSSNAPPVSSSLSLSQSYKVPSISAESLGLVYSSQESWNSGGTNDILPNERSKASFEVLKLTNLLDGGPESTKKRHWILSPGIERALGDDKYHMNRPELIERHFKDFIEIHKSFAEDLYRPTPQEVSWMSQNAMNTGSLMPHYGLFVPTIMGQGSDEQQFWWLFRALTFKIVGCYAQTELGHGSNVRGLKTVATYDKKTEEFVLNTPTLQAMKWWNSNIGCAATHATVFAQLVIDGKEFGLHVFMVQLRDENHKPLPGIEMGDVGPKLGDHAIDTGYLRLKDVRIPRTHLLAKRQHVEADGTYVKHSEGKKEGADKLTYATMMQARQNMVSGSGGKLSIAATIAVRYSCVRHQGFADTSAGVSYASKEKPIIDYQMQLFRVMSQVATAYCIKMTGMWMSDKFYEVMAGGDTEDLPEIHASSAGLKGLCCKIAADGIEDLRKCCGGHGYLLTSGIAALGADYVWQVTAEGDWVVMLLQTARFLIKSLDRARDGLKIPGLTAYLEPFKDPAFNPLTLIKTVHTVAEITCIDYLVGLYRVRAMVAVHAAGERLAAAMKLGQTFDQAWNSCAISLHTAAVCHTYYFMLLRFIDVIKTVSDRGVHGVLSRLAVLFGLANIVNGQMWNGIISGNQMQLVDAAVAEVLRHLRPDAVALVDAFDIPDEVLNSSLGRKDGNVYEHLFVSAKKSILNQKEVFEGYEEHLRPCLDLKMLALENCPIPEDFDDMTMEDIKKYVQQHKLSKLKPKL